MFHREVYEGYMTLLEKYPENITLIDAARPIEEVYKQTIEAIDNLLRLKEEKR